MIYLDNNATTRIAPEVLAAMNPFLNEFYGNPSSSHTFGRESRRAVEHAREQVAALLGARAASEIFFTGSGTESINWAIQAALKLQPGKKRIVTTRVEHEAVARNCEVLERNGCEVVWLDVDEHGLLDLGNLRQILTPQTALVSVMAANNETGVVFPFAEISQIVKERSDALFHVDGVQAVGKIPVNLQETAIDLFAVAGHKFHAPKGCGALFVRDGIELPPLFYGGGQECKRRAGTENLTGIIGLGAASELAKNVDLHLAISRLRDRLENEILDKIPNSRLNGTTDKNRRLPNTANISFSGVEGESILAHLNEHRIFVSTGSACNSDAHTSSPVLRAMNVPYLDAMGAVRFSLSRFTTAAEIDKTLEILPGIIEKLRKLSPLA